MIIIDSDFNIIIVKTRHNYFALEITNTLKFVIIYFNNIQENINMMLQRTTKASAIFCR